MKDKDIESAECSTLGILQSACKELGIDNVLKLLEAVHQYKKYSEMANEVLADINKHFSYDNPMCRNKFSRYNKCSMKCIEADNMFHEVAKSLNRYKI